MRVGGAIQFIDLLVTKWMMTCQYLQTATKNGISIYKAEAVKYLFRFVTMLVAPIFGFWLLDGFFLRLPFCGKHNVMDLLIDSG